MLKRVIKAIGVLFCLNNPKMKDKKIIIFGASGFIGGYLLNYLKDQKKEVIGTYYKNKKKDLVFFDLLNSQIEDLQLDNAKYGIICSAISNIDECKNNQEYSNNLNVIGLKRIVRKLSENSICPIFISSASVFEGSKGGYREKDLRNPINEYGLQKKQVEDFITLNIRDYLIIRLGKIFGVEKANGGIFIDWIEKYKNKKEINCAYDENLSLTYVGDVARGLEELLKKGKKGIFHIDSGIHKSRLDFARGFFKNLQLYDADIQNCSLDDFNFIDKRAKNAYLNSSKFINETNFKFTSLETCYKMIKQNL